MGFFSKIGRETGRLYKQAIGITPLGAIAKSLFKDVEAGARDDAGFRSQIRQAEDKLKRERDRALEKLSRGRVRASRRRVRGGMFGVDGGIAQPNQQQASPTLGG